MIWKVSTGILIVILVVLSCRKETMSHAANTAKSLNVYLTDAPCAFDTVLVDIRVVEVKIDTAHHKDEGDDDKDDKDGDDDHRGHDNFGVWDTLNITPGIYNIADLRNGVDTLLAKGSIKPGTIRKIRLTLGTNNSVVVGGKTYPLHLFPGASPYVYVKIDEEDLEDMHRGKMGLWLDFDICRSIILYNGQYYLKPVISPFAPAKFGTIEGEVHPRAAQAFITAYNSLDTGSAIPNDDGEFKIRGLVSGTYTVVIHAFNGYQDTTINSVMVSAGRETELHDVYLHK